MKKVFAKSFLNKHLGFFLFAVVLLWIKTYAAYQTELNLGIDNSIQQFLLFINPISSAVLFLGLALFAKGRKAFIWMIIIDFLLSFLLYANLVYYRFFNDFITVPTLTQTKNAGDLGQSLGALVKPYDVLYFLDVIILMVLVFGKFVKPENVRMKGKRVSAVLISAVMLFGANLALAEMDRPQLLTRTFDRNYLVKYLGMYNYTIYDAIQSSKSSAQRALADSNDVTEVVNYTKATHAEPNPEYFGKAKGMNVIYISLESLQTFAIDYKINGEEVTPFLNSLTKDKNTLYFDNFFHQTGQGKTSDAEFMVENSLFPLPQGAVFTTKAENTYQAAPAILDQKGYSTAVLHGNYKSFWNRDVMYKSLGYEQFFDAAYYSMKDEDVVNYGLKDKPFFKESIPHLESLEQPFYTKFISLTNHFPYPIDEEEATIDPHTTGDGSVDRYFQTARYMDESLKQFFDDLKKSGLYDNTMIVMYGDHYGISENHNKAMSQVMGKEINGFEHAQLQRTPLFIHAPGLEGGEQHQFGGQVDIRPTLMHLLGIDTKDYVQMGTDLLSKDHQQVVPFRNGDFVTPKFTSVDGKFYDTATGETVEENEDIKQTEEMVDKKLNLSDQIVYGDLLRFYTPKGFEPVDPSKYRYMGPEETEEK
ncbi:LTA synthase family protein [Metabacillus idriensis]|uniref:Sulfatase-like hydrolase/transferase n=1 Tax=Metabacillus idriensis TaxID=324768 RepID=A0A6I2MGG2_9BACI|nr:LTA synthase family protein [Metabacillus idriensis]MCM3595917.1 LTA synthase family protein [Metabacillus idriensis]MRX56247.1 sulfatase-like hydrolase/transferase [Metabacillus idriensis]OHR69772.1 glycerol phosphate lipoteichoic acid synthase [Bacillus sp. HMSC76G11]